MLSASAREHACENDSPPAVSKMGAYSDDLVGAYGFLASRKNAKGIRGTIVIVDAGVTLRLPCRS
jgi:hypothetical protein